jgi:AraC-like DNA-binding protein
MKSKTLVFSAGAAHYRPDTCDALAEAAQSRAVRLKAVVHGSYPGIKLPGTVLPELRTAGCWDMPNEQTWGLDWHRNEGIEFTYLFSGHLGFEVDEKTFALHPGSLTVTRPWQQHRVGLPRVTASRLGWVILDVGVRRPNQTWEWPKWILLSTEEKRQLTSLLRHNEQPVWKAGAAIGVAFKKINKAAESADRKFDRTGMALAINELLLAILRSLDRQNIPQDESLTRSKRTVELFLGQLIERVDEPWTVELMAEHCGLKRSRFTSYCREIINRTPAQYLNHCRVKAAARLLREKPGMSILEIAMHSGFSSSQQFATTFRRIKGSTPSDFRCAKTS